MTDFGVSTLGVHPEAPTIAWDCIRQPESSLAPAQVVLPYVPQGDGNLLQEQADAVSRHAQHSPILEDTNEYVVIMHAPFPPDAQLNDIVMGHLVHHQGIKLEGFHMPEVVEQLTSEYMATHWNVQPARVVEVHGTQFPHLGNTIRQMETPIFPFKKMLHSEFIDSLADPGRSKKILDVPMTHEGAPPPFGLMDDGYDAWNNTSSQYDWPHGLSREQWSDMNWGLLHHATTYTDEHHDTDGKMTLIIGEQGSKLWAVTFPKRPLERRQVDTYFDQALQFAPPTGNNEELCVSFTLVLLPGDIYFQPPGAIHAIYTPEASFTPGARAGLWSTNLDHAPKQVYEGLVWMMLSLPTNPDKHSYLPEHPRAYGITVSKHGATKAQKDLIKQAKAKAFVSVKKCPWVGRAIEYAFRVSQFLSWCDKAGLVGYLQIGVALSDPGERISIAPILREILSEQEAARKAEEGAQIKEAQDAQAANKAKKQGKKFSAIHIWTAHGLFSSLAATPAVPTAVQACLTHSALPTALTVGQLHEIFLDIVPAVLTVGRPSDRLYQPRGVFLQQLSPPPPHPQRAPSTVPAAQPCLAHLPCAAVLLAVLYSEGCILQPPPTGDIWHPFATQDRPIAAMPWTLCPTCSGCIFNPQPVPPGTAASGHASPTHIDIDSGGLFCNAVELENAHSAGDELDDIHIMPECHPASPPSLTSSRSLKCPLVAEQAGGGDLLMAYLF
ncbi:hypothetical protein IW261DRAFT_1570931 [Armillaria novae-zelandiae]|uniref:JmjC domain-containing protein n=1 Tax=Armillaria novae-zelandiae TaxID=153914 RepID=A0AA39NV54_9AGAR|nr:hypothetical protein IW261DRAFT_1570931 [Armillaria novae-zelandiae]